MSSKQLIRATASEKKLYGNTWLLCWIHRETKVLTEVKQRKRKMLSCRVRRGNRAAWC